MDPQKPSFADSALQMSVQVEGEVMLLTYHFNNQRGRPLFLFNVLWDFDPKGKYIPSKLPAYVCWKPDEVHTAKQILPVPRTRSVEFRRIPFATKVDPGQTWSETLRLPVPVPEFNPYFPASPQSKYELRPVRNLTFTLGFLVHSDEVKVEPAPLPEALIVRHNNLFGKVEALSAKPMTVAVNVNKRLDEFEDF